VKRSFILALVGLGVLTAACSSNSSSSSSSAVSATIVRINAAVTKVGTAHFTDTTKIGSQTEVIVGSAGANVADETLLVNNKLNLRILKIDGVLYLKDTSASALESVLAIPNSVAPKYAGAWISVHKGDNAYSNLDQATTLVSELHAYIPTSKGTLLSTFGPTTNLTQKATLSATSKRLSNLTIETSSALPISGLISVSTTSSAETKSVTLSRWGKTISPSVPSGSVALSSLLG